MTALAPDLIDKPMASSRSSPVLLPRLSLKQMYPPRTATALLVIASALPVTSLDSSSASPSKQSPKDSTLHPAHIQVYRLQASIFLPMGALEGWATWVTVVNGTNTSCLAAAVHSSASTGTSSTSPPATLTTTPHTSTAPPTASNPINKRASKTSPGIIAGAIVGALALIAAAFTACLCVSRRRFQHLHDSPQIEARTLPVPPLQAGDATTMALDRPVALGVVESQEAMLLKAAGLLRRMAQQLRKITERVALMEVQIRMNDPPPGYTQGPAS
ncbi:hypothetical protein DFH09DRAFT_1083458 [Mycena vulgaris]|nr:hypothetical protein DFH09DRAFT_1083458 [Mycena vulgaris]